MEISYKELSKYLNMFDTGYGNDENIYVFTKESKPVYMPSRTFEVKLRYIRYIYLLDKAKSITEPLTVSFTEEDLKNIESNEIDKSNFLLLRNASMDFGYVTPDNKYDLLDYPDVDKDILNDINTMYERYFKSQNKSITVSVRPEEIENLNSYEATNLIIDKIEKDIGLKKLDMWVYIIFTDEVKNLNLLYEIADTFKQANDFHIVVYYESKDYTEFCEAKRQAIADAKAASIAKESYCDLFEPEWMNGYDDFAKSYGTYNKAFEHVVECIKSRDNTGKNRFFISNKNPVTQIKCIAELLAWITLRRGYIFVFEPEKLHNAYHDLMHVIINGDILPSDLRFTIGINMPVINTNKWLLGITNLKFNTNRYPVATPVVVTGIKRELKNWKAVPLQLILNDIKCTHEPGNIHSISSNYYGFYAGNSKVSKDDLLNGTEYDLESFTPVNVTDVIINDFQRRCRAIHASLKECNASPTILNYYDVANYSKLFESYLYAFCVLFNDYMGNETFCTLNNIFVLPMEYKGQSIQVACMMDFTTKYLVKPFIFIGEDTYLSETSPLIVDYVYSPRYLIDCETRKSESGVDYSVLNSKLVECVKLMIKSIPAEKMDVARQLTTTQYSKEESETAINEDNAFDWFYPAVNIYTIYNNTTSSALQMVDDAFLKDIDRYIMELISAHYHLSTSGTASQRKLELNANTDVTLIGQADYSQYLKDFICRGLCDAVAINDRTQLNNYFSSPLFNFNGLRYVSYREAFIKWNGRIDSSLKSPSFPSIQPSFMRGRR